MSMEEKVKEVESVFRKLDEEIAQFQANTTLHCKAGCGKCCFKPDIEATILEFLPFALHLFHDGHAEEWHEKLKSSTTDLCLILNPSQSGTGLCSDYQYRGLICRLFGYSARTNKYGNRELITCRIIKEEQATAFEEATQKIQAGTEVPVMSDYYMRLHGIDFELTKDFYPINVAIRKAIETVLQYYAYR